MAALSGPIGQAARRDRRRSPRRWWDAPLQPLLRWLSALAIVAGLFSSVLLGSGTSTGARTSAVPAPPAAVVASHTTTRTLTAAARGALLGAASTVRTAVAPSADQVAAAGVVPDLAAPPGLPWLGVTLLLVRRPRPPTAAAPSGPRTAPTGRAPPVVAAP